MNRAKTSAIVLLLASAVAAYEHEARHEIDEVGPVADVDPAPETGGPRLRKLVRALLAWALGRDRRAERELVA